MTSHDTSRSTPDLARLEAFEDLAAHQRAIRRFTSEDVPNDLVERILAIGTRAPSARNAQPWRFIVVRDRETKAKLGAIFDELGEQMYGAGAPDHTPWEDVPLLIVVTSEYAFGTTEAGVAALGASIYPCVQNILLAAGAAGLGTVLTTRWRSREGDIRPLLGLPDSMAVHAIIPTGWPDRRYGRNRRIPVSELTWHERYHTT
ncbi:MAG: nitroreductase family protein [Dehalococcoidia bacterium]|nr:nitroreductase family protein [Dehalococcoidia bacterium]